MPGEFHDLDVYGAACTLRQRVYKLTALLPPEERHILFPQMRRAAISVANNIAEGHGSRSFRHNISYLYRSRGSANEILDDLSTCEEQGYFRKEHLDDLREQAWTVVRLLNGYVAYLRRRMAEETG